MKGELTLVAEMEKNAFLGIPSADGWDTDLEDPKKKPWLITQVGKFKFFKFVKEDEVDYHEDAKHMWIGAMMKWVVHNLYLVAQDGDNHIYILYDVLNKDGCLAVLGRLAPEHEMVRLVRRAFTRYMKKV
jgi:hypothetical protein